MTLVEMRTHVQAERVAAATGWRLLPAKTAGRLSRCLDAGDSFEDHRAAVEVVSVLFDLYDTARAGELVKVSSGWTVTAAKFEVEWPKDRSVVWSHFGARRKAYNWALGQVKADLDAGQADPDYRPVPWSFPALRKEWNIQKAVVAPWWADNSKEAYASGIADLAAALDNWRTSKAGTRKGPKARFPRFKSRRSNCGRVRFTTGAMRLEPDRRTIVVPRIGPVRSKENTRRVQRRVAKDDARILNMTLSERWGRLFVSVNYAERTLSRRPVAKLGVRAGVDAGLRTLATVADTDGEITEVPNPAPLRATLTDRRQAGRQLSRRIPGSVGHRAAKAKLARLDRRAVHLRREAWHQLTHQLAATYSQVVIEDLDVAAMKQSMGRRAFRRAVSDASLGQLRLMLAYKTGRAGTQLTVADRWFASSQIHHGCGCRLQAPTRLAKTLICQVTGERVDRDRNAALNLRDWPESNASSGLVEASAPEDTQAATRGGTDPGSAADTTPQRRSDRKTTAQAGARRGEAKTEPADKQARNLARGAA
jgi:putative transposase